jgi:hypothetical protein
MTVHRWPRFPIVLGLALILVLACPRISSGQTSPDKTDLLVLQQTLDELAIALPAQIKKIDDPTVRVFLKLRIASVLWSEPQQNTIAESLTVAALDEIDANGAIPSLFADMFRRDLLALLEANAPDTAKRYARKDVDVAFSLLNSKGKEALAVTTLETELANGWVPDLKLLFFLRRLETQQQSFELGRALSIVIAAEEHRAGTIPIEVFSWLTDFYLKSEVQPDLKRRFLAAAVNSTKVSYTLSDAQDVNHAYNLLVTILPQVKLLTPSLYPQAAAQLSSLMTRVGNTRTESEQIDERIRTSRDPLSQIIAEARSATDPILKDELFLQGARLALEKGKLKLSLELATSISADRDHKKWQEQFLNDLVNAAIEKKDPDIAGEAIVEIQSQSIKIGALQRLTLYFFESNDLLKARELLNDTVKAISSIDEKSQKSLALLRLLPLVGKVNNEILAGVGEQTVKTINSIPSPDSPTDKAGWSNYVQKTLMPVTGQALPVFQSLAERDETLALDLVNRIQLKEIKTSALLGVTMAKLGSARKTLNDKGTKNRAYSGRH